ncbi:MAG: hypothetical protein ACREDH_15665 [Methylocella sp.]
MLYDRREITDLRELYQERRMPVWVSWPLVAVGSIALWAFIFYLSALAV